MKTVLHLTYDYIRPGKTVAISRLIEVTKNIANNKVISLYRVTNLNKQSTELNSEGILNIKSFGLPYGILLLRSLRQVVKKIKKAQRANLIDLNSIDIIHAHKLTYEGYIGFLLSIELNRPLLVSLRQTDFRVLRYRPDLHKKIKKILVRSTCIFYIAPYMKKAIKSLLGENFYESHVKDKLIFLPNIINEEHHNCNVKQSKKFLFTALRMDRRSIKRKNIKNLFKVLTIYKDIEQDLYIAGDGKSLNVLKSWVNKYKIAQRVKFLGKIPNSEMDRYYKEAMAFVMPSHSETFGLVYAESLLNGTPLLYSARTGFDGIFKNVGVVVDSHSLVSIGNGLKDLIQNNNFYRENISKLKEKKAFHIFLPQFAKETYRKVLDRSI